MIGNPVKGGGYAVRALHLLSEKKLRVFVLIPLVINILLFSAALYFMFTQLFIFLRVCFIPSVCCDSHVSGLLQL